MLPTATLWSTEWQHMRKQIYAAIVFARSDVLNVSDAEISFQIDFCNDVLVAFQIASRATTGMILELKFHSLVMLINSSLSPVT